MPATVTRRLPVGAEPAHEGVHFRVWAPGRERVEVVTEERGHLALDRDGGGYHAGFLEGAGDGLLYRCRLDGGEPLPDPASRFQPEGPHGPSEVIDPRFPWTDGGWAGAGLEGRVIYEMHVGTFTPEGTWKAATERLPELAEMGIGFVSLLPVADFHGRFGWGYDGVMLFAPTRLYGRPEDFRAFVDRAHDLGVGVLLDVVYNHVGSAGNHLTFYAEDYFSSTHRTEWGEALNFDGANASGVRDFLLANVTYWIREFHLDGFRVDAAQEVHDRSPEHILTAALRRAREVAEGRRLVFVAENEAQDVRLLRPPEEGGFGFDAVWNEDFHHAAKVALTGRREAYYTDYGGTPQEFVSLALHGFLFQGQHYAWQNKRRGTPTFGMAPGCFVAYLDNHDQVANTPFGDRVHRLAAPGAYRAATALLLLGPWTPLLFQGQEYAASAPFFYFADPPSEQAESTRRGRAEHLSQFRSVARPEVQERLADPVSPETFERSKLDPAERRRHERAAALHRDLVRLRRDDPVVRRGRGGDMDGAVLGPEAFVLRYFGEAAGDDRLLVVNLGRELRLTTAPEPLLAPPLGRCWDLLWSSEDPAYGGWGTPPLETGESWRVPGQAAVLLQAVEGTPP